jgi:16S rRNA processing protein RimM
VVKVQGRRGEVAAELHTDFPQCFAERRRLYALGPAGQRRGLYLEDFWPHQGRLVFKFRGFETIGDAESLVGCELQIPLSERMPLESGSFYVSDLVGCGVWVQEPTGARAIGSIADVQFGAGEAPLLIVRQGAAEYMIPLAAEYVSALDLEGKRIELRLPEGMLALDAPLTDEEKRSQQRRDSQD